jgi:Mor family transcriptional regulator
MKIKERGLMLDFVAAAAEATGSRSTAARAVLALRRWFGGQLVYVPLARRDGKTADALRGVLADAVGDGDAEAILERLMGLFGGVQLYIPKGVGGLGPHMAREIYERYDGTQESMNALCREYNLCFSEAYRLYHLGRDEKAQLRFGYDGGDDDGEDAV